MKTVIQVTPKTRRKNRETKIAESLENGFKPKRVSDAKAIELTKDGSFVYTPKSLMNQDGSHHYINTEVGGSKLKKI